MVKEVRFGWDDSFGQPPLDIPPGWDNDLDDLVDDLKRNRPTPRRQARPPIDPSQDPSSQSQAVD